MKNVLIADDDFISLEVLKAMLSLYPISLHSAQDGKAALELAQQVQPHLIILDYEMPEYTGAEVCQQLRQQAIFTHTPILALTSHQTPEEVALCQAAGMNQVLYKPVSPDALAAVMAKYLS